MFYVGDLVGGKRVTLLLQNWMQRPAAKFVFVGRTYDDTGFSMCLDASAIGQSRHTKCNRADKHGNKCSNSRYYAVYSLMGMCGIYAWLCVRKFSLDWTIHFYCLVAYKRLLNLEGERAIVFILDGRLLVISV